VNVSERHVRTQEPHRLHLVTVHTAGVDRPKDGVVTGFTITNAGSGYTSTPTITISGHGEAAATATISYGTDLNTNGSLTAITLANK